MERKKVLGFWDLTLFSFCAIFGVEAIATSAAIGPSAISWWLICIVGYFLPFGLIAAELGSTYPEQGGIYVWIKKGLGDKWAARSIWYYWVALPLWVPAIYIAIAQIIGHMFFPNMSLWPQILIGIIMIWMAVGINLCPLKVSKWVPNFGTVTRLAVIIGMFIAAVIYFLKNGRFANEINFGNIMPDLNAAIVFIPIIIYNLEGCELISAASGEMKNPARDIPKAVILSALAIASLYLITTFAVWVVIPISEINVASGILQVFTITFSGHLMQQVITVVLGFLISSTLFAEIIAWNLGENRTVAEAAKNGELPKVLAKMTKNMAPVGASIVSGIISTVVIIVYGLIAKNAGELFWHVVSFSLVVGLFSYLMLFPSFIISRIKDISIERPYRVPGPDWFAILLAVMAEIFILIALLILFIQPGHDFIRSALPIVLGVLIVVVIGEIFLNRSKRI
ncbi:MAG: APC family permease [Candidatus Omnitrophica bacterium]|nr:APC family permease [Candidatus Omnitrophota bacterium]